MLFIVSSGWLAWLAGLVGLGFSFERVPLLVWFGLGLAALACIVFQDVSKLSQERTDFVLFPDSEHPLITGTALMLLNVQIRNEQKRTPIAFCSWRPPPTIQRYLNSNRSHS